VEKVVVLEVVEEVVNLVVVVVLSASDCRENIEEPFFINVVDPDPVGSKTYRKFRILIIPKSGSSRFEMIWK
jgi:hypothetical protein